MRKLTLLLIPLLAVVALWLSRDGANSTPAGPSRLDPAAEREATTPLAPPIAGLETPNEEAVRAERTAAIEAAGEQARASAHGRTHVRGRVEWPAGYEPDDSLEVFWLRRETLYGTLVATLADEAEDEQGAGSRELREWLVTRATVEPDGTFELEAPSDRPVLALEVHLMLRGRHLFLRESRRVRSREEDVLLRPELGACVRGGVRTPGGEPHATALELRPIGGEFTPTAMMTGELGGEHRASGADGRFVFRALPIEPEYELVAAPEAYAMTALAVGSLAAGETRELELVLAAGGRVSGRVVDEAGRGVSGATVEALWRGHFFGFDDAVASETTSGADGAFELDAVPLGEVSLRANQPGRLGSAKVRIELDGDRPLAGIELALASGRTIEGRAQWPDGRPAAGARVTAEFDPTHMAGPAAMAALRGGSGETTCDDQGAFRLTGLGAGPFVVVASAPADGTPADESASDESTWHRAHRDGVTPGTAPLELVLHPPLGLSGVVADRDGRPLELFEVHAARLVEGAMGEVALDNRREAFDTPDGAFVMSELIEGRWRIEARAEGYVTVEPLAIELPRSELDPIRIVMERAATIRGRVLTQDGTGVRGARVELDDGQPVWMGPLMGGPPAPETTSDDGGTFELLDVRPGEVAILADAPDSCASLPLPLTVASGEVLEDVELRLREGGRLTGVAYRADGRPAAGYMITLNRVADFDTRTTHADGAGEFVLDHLAPGSWQVVAMDGRSDWSGDGESGFDLGAMMDSIRLTQAEISEGQTTHVVIGAPPEDPIELTGEVTQGGAPYEGAVVSFFPEGEGIYERLKIASVDAEGRYRVVLEQSGDYVVNVQRMPGGVGQQTTIEFAAEIPSGVSEHRLDFEIPLGRISGRVLGPSGAPAVGARVTLSIDGGARSDRLMGGQYAEISTDEAGRYDLEGLRPGVYRLAAGGAALFGVQRSSSARVVRGGLRVGEDEWLEGIDFRLPEPGRLAISVHAAGGGPIGGATIFLRDANGRMLEPFSLAVTDAKGALEYGGLAPGDYTVLARAGADCCEETGPVRVRPGEETTVELVLDAGATLWVQLEDKDLGTGVSASVRVLDEQGRELAGMFSLADLQHIYMDGNFSPTEHRLGPLAPGKYRVEASTSAGKSAAKSVTIRAGDGERKVRLRLKD